MFILWRAQQIFPHLSAFNCLGLFIYGIITSKRYLIHFDQNTSHVVGQQAREQTVEMEEDKSCAKLRPLVASCSENKTTQMLRMCAATLFFI